MITTKPRKHYDYYCTGCETFLSGNGSLISPHRCECGTWERPDGVAWELKEAEDVKKDR